MTTFCYSKQQDKRATIWIHLIKQNVVGPLYNKPEFSMLTNNQIG